MTRKEYNLDVTFRGEKITLYFVHRNGDLAFADYNVHTKDGQHQFVTTCMAGKFSISQVKSFDSSNLYFAEMEKIINKHKDEFFID